MSKATLALVDSYRATPYSVQMFSTLPEFRVSMPNFSGFERYSWWGVVEVSSELPWFIVHLRQTLDEDESAAVSYLVSRTEQVQHLLDSLTEAQQTRGLHLVLPAAYAGTRTWAMKEVKHMWQGSISTEHGKFQLWLHETTDGAFIVDPPMDAKPDDFEKERLVYPRTT